MQMHSACQETINEDLTVEAISAAIYHSHPYVGAISLASTYLKSGGGVYDL
jgi:hypothetical protein